MGYSYYRYIKAITNGVELTASGGTSLIQVTNTGTASIIKGGDTAGDELRLASNQSDTYPDIRMIGGGSLITRVGAGEKQYMNTETTQGFAYEYASNISTISGGGVTGDKLYLKANTIDDWPRFRMDGLGWFGFDVPTGSGIYISEQATDFVHFKQSGGDSIIYARPNNNNLYLQTAGTGVVKFGTHNAITTETNSGYITIKDSGGTSRKLCVVS